MERLHLPLIDSPSLFHRPTTPQMCSTQVEFEWTIDEVSSLNPANVEAHEAQFQSTIDPETEARAQAAITSYFKERIIVPSPDDCPLRDQKIHLNKRESAAVGRTTRNQYCQTKLTLPPILPKEVEDALQPYFRTPTEDCDSPASSTMQDSSMIDYDARDESLRRKLFQTIPNTNEPSAEFGREVYLDSPVPQTPEMDLKNIRRSVIGQRNAEQNERKSPLDSTSGPMDCESFGYFSPISKEAVITLHSKQTSLSIARIMKDGTPSSLLRSTPDKSSIFRWNPIDMSTDNAVNGSHSGKRKTIHMNDDRSPESNETANFSYDDETQLSYGSQQHPQTPTLNKSKRRCNSVSRKNLSRSFNQIEEHQNSAISLDRTDSGLPC